MRKFISIITLIIFYVFLTSCSKDDPNADSVVGTWKLITWTIELPIDLNNDTMSSTNLLDEAICINNERLIFGVDGTVSSNMSYNPKVIISLSEGTTNDYVFHVVCDTDGVIGTSGSYSQNDNSVALFNTSAVISGNQLTVIYMDAIDIYNTSLTEVVATKDLRLVYTRK